MPEPVHMPLSAFDWATVLLFAFLGWWAIRALIHVYVRAKADLQQSQQANEEERAQRILRQQESLEGSVRDLIKVVSDLKTWVVIEFVRRPDHDREIARLETAIAGHAERFTRELESHREECPVRRG